MNKFGDFFSNEMKRKLAQQNIEIGTVLRMFVADTNPPKVKYFVVVGFCSKKISVASVYINSEINPNVFPTQELKNLHHLITVNEHDFLDYDSYVDCSQITEKEFDDLVDKLANNFQQTAGNLQEKDLEIVLNKIKGAVTISDYIKIKYNEFDAQ